MTGPLAVPARAPTLEDVAAVRVFVLSVLASRFSPGLVVVAAVPTVRFTAAVAPLPGICDRLFAFANDFRAENVFDVFVGRM